MLFRYAPNVRAPWRWCLFGAAVFAVLWLVATFGFGIYITRFAHYNVMYGSIGAAIALLVWMYMIAAIALIGCEFNAEWERMGRQPASDH